VGLCGCAVCGKLLFWQSFEHGLVDTFF